MATMKSMMRANQRERENPTPPAPPATRESVLAMFNLETMTPEVRAIIEAKLDEMFPQRSR